MRNRAPIQTINITDFHGYNIKAFYEHLKSHRKNKWQIALVKPLWSPEHNNQLIVRQYYSAMYIGEKLAALCAGFGYSVPCPYIAGEFLFDVQIKRRNILQIATVLAFAAKGYMTLRADEDWRHFQEETRQFFKSTDGPGRITPVCTGLLAICEQFFEHYEE